jgi:hypothetical protein
MTDISSRAILARLYILSSFGPFMTMIMICITILIIPLPPLQHPYPFSPLFVARGGIFQIFERLARAILIVTR